ncbi:MAG: serine/threonine-protein kinase [Myxococcales bacterium]|nr:serine/threonine-protein kinase [Myxococcales bacterium]
MSSKRYSRPPRLTGDDLLGSASAGSRRLLETEERDLTTVRVAVPDESSSSFDRASLVPAPARAPLDFRGRYDDLGTIAHGGMATVHRARDRWTLRQIALKRRREIRNPVELARFVEEVQITAQLDHPNIVPIHDVEIDADGIPTHFTMKLVQGRTLNEVIADHPVETLHGPALREFIGIFLKVCDAVSFAHSRGVVHRDLKPANIMVGAFGQVYVMDWGIALLTEGQRPSRSIEVRVQLGGRSSNVEATGTLSGTPAYMAPEQAQGRNEDIDARTDVYGLGGILYYFLTASPPHKGQDASDELILAMSGNVMPPHRRAPERRLPHGLCRIAEKALARNPAERYATVRELANDLEDFLRGGGWLEQRTFEAGSVIVQEGEIGDCAYLVLTGLCGVTKRDGELVRSVATLGPAEVFGETSLLAGGPRTASVHALTEVRLLVVTREALERELEAHGWLHVMMEALASRFMQQDRELKLLRKR